jgi:hypothetical protein
VAKHQPSRPLSRRAFGRRVALATAAAGVIPSARVLGMADASRTDGAGGHHARFTQDGPTSHALSPEGRERLESMWQNVQRKHGDRLTEEQKVRMRKIIANNVRMLESVYAVPVKNGDAPATALRLVEDRSRPGSAGTSDHGHR